jgi:hypothetical protein
VWFDVVFLIDATASMQPYIDGARASVARSADEIMTRFSSAKFRWACVCYRDKPDPRRFETYTFAEEIGKLTAWLSKIEAKNYTTEVSSEAC